QTWGISFIRPAVRTCDAQSDVWAGGTDRLRGSPDNWRSDAEWSAVFIAYKPYAARGTTRENAERPRPSGRLAHVKQWCRDRREGQRSGRRGRDNGAGHTPPHSARAQG